MSRRGIRLPHVPGHELAGKVVATGKGVMRFNVGDRVTVPFVSGCGHCSVILATSRSARASSSRALPTGVRSPEYVAIDSADTDLVALPEEIDDATAANLTCRFATSFRVVADQARTGPGDLVTVHGCGGVGLSAIMIATALGANVIGINLTEDKIALARQCGAVEPIKADSVPDVVEAVREITKGGAHVFIDALGHPATCFNSIKNLRRRGRHVQVGLMLGEHATPQIPMAQVIGHELEIYGSHGMQAWRYDAMLSTLTAGKMKPQQLISKRINLEAAVSELVNLDKAETLAIAVVTSL
ncbi:zinc-binding dehydrogenase [Neorhizobium sp. SOG26]|uniref:zinc-binding dehydrogenase n=1 Tax=Neorhizobium sp. SOG26 TaxID=2060726 RepID=UPI0026CB8290